MVHQMGLSLGRFWAVVIISLWAGVALAAPTAEEIAQRLQARYEDTTSLEARFIQEAFWKSTQRVKVSRGVVFFEKPGKMRWEYKIPEKVLIVADRRHVYVFRPASRPVMVVRQMRCAGVCSRQKKQTRSGHGHATAGAGTSRYF